MSSFMDSMEETNWDDSDWEFVKSYNTDDHVFVVDNIILVKLVGSDEPEPAKILAIKENVTKNETLVRVCWFYNKEQTVEVMRNKITKKCQFKDGKSFIMSTHFQVVDARTIIPDVNSLANKVNPEVILFFDYTPGVNKFLTWDVMAKEGLYADVWKTSPSMCQRLGIKYKFSSDGHGHNNERNETTEAMEKDGAEGQADGKVKAKDKIEEMSAKTNKNTEREKKEEPKSDEEVKTPRKKRKLLPRSKFIKY